MRVLSIVACSTLALSLGFASTLADSAKSFGIEALPADEEALNKLVNEYSPDSEKYPTTKERVELGKMLYFDPRLSKSGIISCNTCHHLGFGGTDNVPASTGHKWTPNPRHLNSPTVYNAVFNTAQFWDGRAEDLAAQAAGPMVDPAEMASTPEHIEAVIHSIPEYVELFKEAYGADVKVDYPLIATTVGVFERTLVTPTRFDDFLNGDEKALSDAEKEGLQLFLDKGCATCHNGINLGGTMQAFEVVEKYQFADLGGFTGDENGLVKTPVLRNILKTAPYFHNGAFWDIKDAIKEMGSTQLGIEISDAEAASMATFFEALEGRMPEIIYPMLPNSTLDTPKPELDYNK
ncbi:MAG: cytochrome-c peroxidase [Campylobacteraceae bacterium]|nr:cytochrome-c peroxidase [Campylobacteraceae bacterium]